MAFRSGGLWLESPGGAFASSPSYLGVGMWCSQSGRKEGRKGNAGKEAFLAPSPFWRRVTSGPMMGKLSWVRNRLVNGTLKAGQASCSTSHWETSLFAAAKTSDYSEPLGSYHTTWKERKHTVSDYVEEEGKEEGRERNRMEWNGREGSGMEGIGRIEGSGEEGRKERKQEGN